MLFEISVETDLMSLFHVTAQCYCSSRHFNFLWAQAPGPPHSPRFLTFLARSRRIATAHTFLCSSNSNNHRHGYAVTPARRPHRQQRRQRSTGGCQGDHRSVESLAADAGWSRQHED